MSSRSDTPGLVATSGSQMSAALGELINCCGWPALLQASARRLDQELIVRNLGCVLFWIEDSRDVRATTKLVAWLRQREPRLFRVAIAYRLGDDVEPAVRRAGIHSFIHAKGDIAAVVNNALWPQLAYANIHANTSITFPARPTALSGAPTNLGISPELPRPP